jgi:hypothetical protein
MGPYPSILLGLLRERAMSDHRRTLAAALGAAVGAATLTAPAGAAHNPFGMTELPRGYLQLAADGGGAEGKCASKPAKAGPEAAGDKAPEGRSASKPAADEAAGEKPAGTKGKEMACGKGREMACGEGKCGAMMKKGG